MTDTEVKDAVQQLKSEGYDESQIIGGYFDMFKNGEIDFDGFQGILSVMGYEVTDEFKNMSDEEKKKQEWSSEEEPTGETDERAPKEIDDESESKPEDDEESKAMEMFGVKDKKDEDEE